MVAWPHEPGLGVCSVVRREDVMAAIVPAGARAEKASAAHSGLVEVQPRPRIMSTFMV